MTRLEGDGGRLAILGGRDEVGGGTWLATNEAGVVAGLTNRPLRDGPDAAKRSRGELPLALARCPTAATAVEAFGTAIDPGAYNPSWLLVADRQDAFFVDVTATEEVIVEHLRPGVHVLENRNLHETSPKAERVRELLDPALASRQTVLLETLPVVLADHHLPPGEPPADSGNPRLAGPHARSASMPTRTTTARVRRPSSPSPTRPPRQASAGPTTRRATDGGRELTISGHQSAPHRTRGRADNGADPRALTTPRPPRQYVARPSAGRGRRTTPRIRRQRRERSRPLPWIGARWRARVPNVAHQRSVHRPLHPQTARGARIGAAPGLAPLSPSRERMGVRQAGRREERRAAEMWRGRDRILGDSEILASLG